MRTFAALSLALALLPSPVAAERARTPASAVAQDTAVRSGAVLDRNRILRTPDGVYAPGADGRLRVLPGADSASFECFVDSSGPGLCRDARRVWGLDLEPLPQLDAGSLRALVGGCAGNIVGYRDDDGYYGPDGARLDRPPDQDCPPGKRRP